MKDKFDNAKIKKGLPRLHRALWDTDEEMGELIETVYDEAISKGDSYTVEGIKKCRNELKKHMRNVMTNITTLESQEDDSGDALGEIYHGLVGYCWSAEMLGVATTERLTESHAADRIYQLYERTARILKIALSILAKSVGMDKIKTPFDFGSPQPMMPPAGLIYKL